MQKEFGPFVLLTQNVVQNGLSCLGDIQEFLSVLVADLPAIFDIGCAILLALLAYAPTCCVGLHAQSSPTSFETKEEVWANMSQANPERERGLGSSAADPTQDLRAFEPAPEPTPASGNQTVSVDELRHPPSRKGQKLIDKIEKELQAGDPSSAMEELNLAVKEPSAAPYAHNILGVEYLKIHKVSEAVDELEAIALLPGFAAGHSNLGCALCLDGQSERGFQEIETALNLDRSFLRAHFLKGVILMDRGAGDHEDGKTWRRRSGRFRPHIWR